MGVRLLSVDGGGDTCLFDSTTGWAFGPVASENTLNDFVDFLDSDARKYSQDQLAVLWKTFLESRENMSVVSEEG